MARPFDAATKHLIEMQPADWLEYVGMTRAEVAILDAELSSISAAGDKILRVQEVNPWILHLELQAGYESDMIERFHFYVTVVAYRHHLPVHLFVILLRPEADGPNVTGLLERFWPDGICYERFQYNVVRVWETPVSEILAGGLATLPLAPIAAVAREELPSVIRRMDERISAEVTSEGEQEDLWTATLLLMGLRYQPDFSRQLLQGVRNMRESTTYMAILEEGMEKGIEKGREEGMEKGRIEEARNFILRLGTKRFGIPESELQSALEAIAEIARLEALGDRLLEVETWNELLKEA